MSNSYPSDREYRSALEDFTNNVNVDLIEGGTTLENPWQDIKMISGGCGAVFPIEVKGEITGLRCWTDATGAKQAKVAKKRIPKIKDYLSSFPIPIPYFVNYTYFDKGITVKNDKYPDGNSYPVSCIDWIAHPTLNNFLEDNYQNSPLILELAEAFKAMVEKLHDIQVSHGDLQDENIMVVQKSNGSIDLKLIDYDSLYVPDLFGEESTLDGVKSYQHPKRSDLRTLDMVTDYFSELVIYLSLRVYAIEPNRWKNRKESALLFGEKDFSDPNHASIFKELQTIGDTEIQHLTTTLQDFCHRDIRNLLPLEEVISTQTRNTEIADKVTKLFKERANSSQSKQTTLNSQTPKTNIEAADKVTKLFRERANSSQNKQTTSSPKTSPTTTEAADKVTKLFKERTDSSQGEKKT